MAPFYRSMKKCFFSLFKSVAPTWYGMFRMQGRRKPEWQSYSPYTFPLERQRGRLSQQFDFEKDFLFSEASIGKAILCVK